MDLSGFRPATMWLQSGGGDSSTKLVTLSMAVATMELCGGKTSSVASMMEYCNMFLFDPATNKDPVLKQEIALAAAALKAFKSPTVSDHIRPILLFERIANIEAPKQYRRVNTPKRYRNIETLKHRHRR